MPENINRIDEFLASTEFNGAFLDWRRACRISNITGARFHNKLLNYHAEGHGVNDEVQDIAEYAVESDDEWFEDIYSGNEEILRSRQQSIRARHVADRLRAGVIGLGEQFDVGQFANYGLRVYLQNGVTKAGLRFRVNEAEQDLTRIDKLVRDNPGKLLTVLDLGMRACVLRGVGITIDERDQVVILPAEGKKCYEMDIISDIGRIYETNNLRVPATSVHSSFRKDEKAKVLTDWSGFLNVAQGNSLDVGCATFAVGDMVDGELNLEGVRDRDIKFFQRILYRTRIVGKAALNGPNPEFVVVR